MQAAQYTHRTFLEQLQQPLKATLARHVVVGGPTLTLSRARPLRQIPELQRCAAALTLLKWCTSQPRTGLEAALPEARAVHQRVVRHP